MRASCWQEGRAGLEAAFALVGTAGVAATLGRGTRAGLSQASEKQAVGGSRGGGSLQGRLRLGVLLPPEVAGEG